MICGSSHILEKNLHVQIPIFFRKMNHGFLHELTLIYKFVRVPAD
ncbi:hypothetical protein LEP1GSC049_1581 [Leptospira kirschneri serovar Cynopteri str. 3522 CT]|nr:hypothetical protein LEP1GSC049_1581 [Leptospira kirschneri serovar Cynopteri str. 3522 CT]